jgi:undecaprenyl-diphosphatase
MTILQALILGILQGITEFLPISSSAHLVIAPFLLGWKIPEEQTFPFDVLVQIGTLLAVIVYFRHDLWEIIRAVFIGIQKRAPFADAQARLGWLILLATLPAGILGVLIKEAVERAFNSPRTTAFFLFGTALLLVLAEVIGKRIRKLDSLNWKDALVIGLAQALALFPGISRSGATIAGGMLRNFERKSAARFSFLMMIPIMLAAGFLSLLDLLAMPNMADFLPTMLTGFIASAVVGYLAIHWLLGYLRRRPLYIFAAYCAALAVVTLIISYV